MTKPTKAQLRKALEHSLRVYRLAQEAAKAGKWALAERLTEGIGCRFCRLFCSPGGPGCDSCAAIHICDRNPQGNARVAVAAQTDQGRLFHE